MAVHTLLEEELPLLELGRLECLEHLLALKHLVCIGLG